MLSNEFSPSEYIKIDVGWGFALDSLGELTALSPDALAGFKGAASRQEENKGGRTRGSGKQGKGGERRKWGREGKGGKLVEQRLGCWVDRCPCL